MMQEISREYRMLLERKAMINRVLVDLPCGYISKKKINGKTYSYLQQRVDQKISSRYLKGNEEEDVAEGLALRNTYEAELPLIAKRLNELESAAKLLNDAFFRRLLVFKIGVGMDLISTAQKEQSLLFSEAMTTVEGAPISHDARQELETWKNGETPFLITFERTLQRYGFLRGGVMDA